VSVSPPPPAGPPAAVGPHRTCDASGMAEIHRLYRSGFGEAPSLVRGVAAGDTAHADAVAGQLHLLSASLHTHHEGEDARLWDTITARAPGCALHVERMKAQHAEMLRHLGAMDDALVSWRRTATGAEPVLAALDGINAALATHLPDEEATIVPVIETTLTPREAAWFGEHGRRATPRGQTWNVLGAILAAQPDGGDAWLRKNLPGPVRLLWRAVGRRRYAAHRAGLVRP
jgi:hypothetical protein